MALWGNTNLSAQQPKYATRSGAGGDPTLATTAGANHGNTIFGVPTATLGQNRGAHAGWNKITRGTGGVASANVTGAGSGYYTGDTITVSNGTSNATLTVTANATTNITSIAVTSGGAGWPNSSVAVVTFNNEKHLTAVTISGTAVGYSNTDTIHFGNGSVNATATFVTNATGGFVTANVTIVTRGLFPNALANNQLSVTIFANTGANSAGTGATATGGLANGAGGTATVTIGGRAGRNQYETLVAMGSMAANTNGGEFNNLP